MRTNIKQPKNRNGMKHRYNSCGRWILLQINQSKISGKRQHLTGDGSSRHYQVLQRLCPRTTPIFSLDNKIYSVRFTAQEKKLGVDWGNAEQWWYNLSFHQFIKINKPNIQGKNVTCMKWLKIKCSFKE